MRVEIVMLDKEGNGTTDKSKALEAMVTFYEDKKFRGEVFLYKPTEKMLDDEYLIELFKRLKGDELRKTGIISPGEGAWKPRYSNEEEEEEEEE